MQRVTAEEKKTQVNMRVQTVIKVLIALTTAGAVLAIYMVGFTDRSAAKCDFISYWAAGQLLRQGQNPYEAQAVRALEVRAGRDPGIPILVMRNPPLAFPLAAPLGWIGAKSGLILWIFLLFAALSLASYMLWSMNGRPDSLLNFYGLGFPPVIACLMAGQIGILLLLGITLFLFLRKDRAFLAGASLWLCALKPHLFVPFGIALFMWCLTNKKGYRILAGFGVALSGSCAVAYVADPNAWAQYAALMRTGGPLNEVVPSWSAQLRLVTNPHAVWIQFVPEAVAAAWAAWYFWTRRQFWDWMDHGLVLLLAGAISTPYGFINDESMVLPAVLTGAFRCIESRRPLWPLGVLTVAGLLQLEICANVVSRYYLWTTPAWLCWYLYSTRKWGHFHSKVM